MPSCQVAYARLSGLFFLARLSWLPNNLPALGKKCRLKDANNSRFTQRGLDCASCHRPRDKVLLRPDGTVPKDQHSRDRIAGNGDSTSSPSAMPGIRPFGLVQNGTTTSQKSLAIGRTATTLSRWPAKSAQPLRRHGAWISIPYLGAIATRRFRSSSVAAPDCGERSVASRPASRKNWSSPAGVARISIFAGVEPMFLK